MTDQKQTTDVRKKRLVGVVVRHATKDTTVVEVRRYVRHPKYGKYVLRRKRYAVHEPDPGSEAGSRITIEECNPVSKSKRFRVVAGQ